MKRLQHGKFLGVFHAFAAYADAAARSQFDDVGQKTQIVGAVLNAAHEAAVDLDLVDGQFFQPAQAGIAGPEIVHGDRYALLLPSAEHGVQIRIVLKLPAFRDLDGESASGKTARRSSFRTSSWISDCHS